MERGGVNPTCAADSQQQQPRRLHTATLSTTHARVDGHPCGPHAVTPPAVQARGDRHQLTSQLQQQKGASASPAAPPPPLCLHRHATLSTYTGNASRRVCGRDLSLSSNPLESTSHCPVGPRQQHQLQLGMESSRERRGDRTKGDQRRSSYGSVLEELLQQQQAMGSSSSRTVQRQSGSGSMLMLAASSYCQTQQRIAAVSFHSSHQTAAWQLQRLAAHTPRLSPSQLLACCQLQCTQAPPPHQG